MAGNIHDSHTSGQTKFKDFSRSKKPFFQGPRRHLFAILQSEFGRQSNFLCITGTILVWSCKLKFQDLRADFYLFPAPIMKFKDFSRPWWPWTKFKHFSRPQGPCGNHTGYMCCFIHSKIVIFLILEQNGCPLSTVQLCAHREYQV